MYRVQVWSEEVKRYFDAHLIFDHIWITGYKPATSAEPATEFATGAEALQASDDLALAAEVVCCVLDLSTSQRHFDEGNLVD